MDRLTTLDAEFLHIDDGVGHMHIAALCIFENPAPSLEELSALIASKLHLIPRYRQRVRRVPLDLGRPVWVDDPDFHLDYHLRRTALPEPGGDEELTTLVGRLASQPLDPQRPLWEIWLVEGLADGRWALVCKVHHCMVDGIAGMGLLTVLLDIGADTVISEPEPWTPRNEPAGPALVLDAWMGLGGDLASWASDIPHRVAHPLETLRGFSQLLGGVLGFVRNLTTTPKLSIEGEIGSHRRWAHSTASIADVKTIRTAFGGTINDVVLTAVTGGYRALLVEHGEDPDCAQVRAMIPASVRADDEEGANRVSMMLYELPVRLADPVERLRAVQHDMSELKSSHMVEAGAAIFDLGDFFPPAVIGMATRLAVRTEHSHPQQVVNTVVTNIPGPQFPIYCLGRKMLATYPYVGISYGVRITTAVLSYDGRLNFGVTGDYDTATDISVIADATAAGITELRSRALTPTKAPPKAKTNAPKADQTARARRGRGRQA